MTGSTLAAVVDAAVIATAPQAQQTTTTVAAPTVSPDQIAAAKSEGEAAGRVEGAKAERTRIKTIVGSEEAKGREALAAHLAFSTDTEAGAAVELLKVAARAEPAKTTNRLDALVTDPKVGADAPRQTSEEASTAGLAAAVDTLIKR